MAISGCARRAELLRCNDDQSTQKEAGKDASASEMEMVNCRGRDWRCIGRLVHWQSWRPGRGIGAARTKHKPGGLINKGAVWPLSLLQRPALICTHRYYL